MRMNTNGVSMLNLRKDTRHEKKNPQEKTRTGLGKMENVELNLLRF